MRKIIPTYQQAVTWIFITLTITGTILWLSDGSLHYAGIPIFFSGVIGFILHDLIPHALRPRRVPPSIINHKQHSTRRDRELVWKEYGHELSTIGILYQHYIKYYPRWIHRRNDYYVPMMISDASSFTDHRVRIILNGHEYLFSFADTGIDENEPSRLDRGLLELFSNNDKVLGLHMLEEPSEHGPYWKVVGLEKFIDGPWRQDFQKLRDKIAQEIEERKRDSRQS